MITVGTITRAYIDPQKRIVYATVKVNPSDVVYYQMIFGLNAGESTEQTLPYSVPPVTSLVGTTCHFIPTKVGIGVLVSRP